MADRPYSIHPHGIAYGKQSEGAQYFDNTSLKEKEDDLVQPNSEHVYHWEVTADIVPQQHDPPCLTYTYISHQNVVQDYNSGLIGTLLICKPGSLDEFGHPTLFHHESVLLFGVFDEKESWYQPQTAINHVKYTINGYTHGSLPDVSVCAHSTVSLHLMGMSSEAELFSVHVNGHVLQQAHHKVPSVGLISGSATTASMIPVHTGRWLLSSKTAKHMEVGMYGFVDVKTCEDFPAPRRRMTIAQKRKSTEWTFYIAAEEMTWNYAPNIPAHIDEDFKSQYLMQSSSRIGRKYKKVVYTLYKNESFTERLEAKQRKAELGILGPVIRAQIRDKIKIVFKNMASRPYSIYPHGLTIEKSQEGVNYPAGGNQSRGVLPGETQTYVWNVLEEDEPLDGDSRCLTRMYYSAVDTARDIASGLIGPLLICRSESLNVRNVQLKADKEQHAMFAVFDENKSWYLDDNIRQYTDASSVTKADPSFYKSNVMHTVNGYMFDSGQVLGFCYGEIVTWHVSSIGAQDYIQTATFYGHRFQLNDRTEDFLSLYPMTGETIAMTMENIGVWLMATLSSHETTKGMRVKFQDVKCFRDYEYEYENQGETTFAGSAWNPQKRDPKEKEKEVATPTVTQTKPGPIDSLTENYIDELGLRSLKDQSQDPDVEQLDLQHLLDYDAVDVPDGNTNMFPDISSTSKAATNRNGTSASTLNDTLAAQWNDLDGENIMNQSITENTTHILIHNSSTSQTENTTVEATIKIEELDLSTETYIDELGLRSLKDQSLDPDVEQLDLQHLLDYDAVDVPDGNTNMFPDISSTSKAATNRNGTSASTLNDTLAAQWNDLDGQNIMNQSISENTTHILIHNSSTSQTENTTVEATIKIEELDLSTETYIEELGLRSLKNQSQDSDIEQLDLSSLDNNDDVDVLGVNGNITFNSSSTGTKTITINVTTTSKTQAKDTLASQWNDLDGRNMTKINQSISENTTHIFHNSSRSKTENATVEATIMFEKYEDEQAKIEEIDLLNESIIENTTHILHSSFNVNVSLISTNMTTETNLTTILSANRSSTVEVEKNYIIPNGDYQTSVSMTQSEESEERITRGDVLSYHENVSSITITRSKSSETNSDSLEKVTAHGQLNHTSSSESSSREKIRLMDNTAIPDNQSLSSSPVEGSSSEELDASESSEEVFIYLKDNYTEVIKTKSINLEGHNWTYDSTHQKVPMEVSDYMKKYLIKEKPQTATPPKTVRKVNRRHWPEKGLGMKTKRKKELKPESRTGLPFSPRGFNPRGARPIFNAPQPVSDEEAELINMPVIIGVPRPDFSDYELYVPGDEPDHLGVDDTQTNVKANEYEYVTYKDPYSSHEDIKHHSLDDLAKHYLKISGPNIKTYFIAAEEVEWNFGGYGQRRVDRSAHNNRETKFTKVVFRGYLDGSFQTPEIHGEVEEHLGILGPTIKAEVDQSIMVVFRNKANRPYSLHPNGVSYTKQTEGLSYEDESKHWYKHDNEVQPNTTFTYLWKASPQAGPLPGESECRTWVYYSGVNPERDIHSGLIGPLLVCRKGSLDKKLVDTREFMMLFMTFDESQSWYYEKNRERMERKSRRTVVDPKFKEKLKFHSINGIIYSLKGLRMYTNQLVRWHLFNMGSPKDFQSIHFHGQTFLHKKTTNYRQAVYPLLPGSFATLEMLPSKPGLWQLETEVGLNQRKGMQTLFLVLDNDCSHPLGLQSGSVKDHQITADKTRGYWEPHLARLNNQGKYNAWSTEKNNSWIQVDFLRPVVISQVATQGAKQMFYSHYVTSYAIYYSTDRKYWNIYKGDNKEYWKIFTGNEDAYQTNGNTFFPPLVGRFIRLYPLSWHNSATVRMEFYGCELDGCSVPLGIESRLIADEHMTASSIATSWYSGPWKPSLARLNKQGSVNAWQALNNDMNQWLQVTLPQVKKITGIITQGAKSMGSEMYVISYALQYSDDGTQWKQYTDDEEYMSKTFKGNMDNNDHVKNYIYPPIFSRFIRIIPITWRGSITMRIELLGCDFE
ncbi:coagulation factor V isoform X1 [Genypterus blacodes]